MAFLRADAFGPLCHFTNCEKQGHVPVAIRVGKPEVRIGPPLRPFGCPDMEVLAEVWWLRKHLTFWKVLPRRRQLWGILRKIMFRISPVRPQLCDPRKRHARCNNLCLPLGQDFPPTPSCPHMNCWTKSEHVVSVQGTRFLRAGSHEGGHHLAVFHRQIRR
jgi:hypothetical protein